MMNSVTMYKESRNGFTVVFENVTPDTKNILCSLLNGALKPTESNPNEQHITKNSNKKDYAQKTAINMQFFQDGDDFVIRFRNGGMGLFQIMKELTKAIVVDSAQTVVLDTGLIDYVNPTTMNLPELSKPEEFCSAEELDEEMAQTALEARMSAVFDSAFKKYEGKRPYDILSSDNPDAQKDLGNITYLIRKSPYLGGVLYDACIDAVLRFLKNTWREIADLYNYAGTISEEEVIDFFKYYEYVIPDDVKKKFSDQSGYKDYKSWKENSSMAQKRSAMATILLYFQENPESLF